MAKAVMDEVEIYCDGSCSPNPGPGGYGCILRFNGTDELELSGGDPATTNNRMEMMSAIAALEALTAPCRVTVTSDSQYLVRGMTEWLDGWQERGWMTASGNPVVNRDLWERLIILSACHDINWVWIRGHAGHVYNERCDVLAQMAAVANGSLQESKRIPEPPADLGVMSVTELIEMAVWPYHKYKDELLRRLAGTEPGVAEALVMEETPDAVSLVADKSRAARKRRTRRNPVDEQIPMGI